MGSEGEGGSDRKLNDRGAVDGKMGPGGRVARREWTARGRGGCGGNDKTTRGSKGGVEKQEVDGYNDREDEGVEIDMERGGGD